jgi:hypothetical protein
MTSNVLPQPKSPPTKLIDPRIWRPRAFKWIWRGLVIGICAALAIHAWQVWLTNNIHAVIPGRVYRSAQLSPEDLDWAVRRYEIRTVVNLRGCGNPAPWYLEEARKTHQLQVQQADIALSAGRLPSHVELRRLLRVLDETDYPILLHCYRGADRTGVAAAIVALLQPGVGFTEARRQLGLFYGHVSIGRPSRLDDFLDSYAEWLQKENLTHSHGTIREWIDHGYIPADCRCHIELVDSSQRFRVGSQPGIRVRCRNIGTKSWRLRPGNSAGTHVDFQIWSPDGSFQGEYRAGLLEATIAPQESIDVTLPLPTLRQKGRYHLLVDMLDEQHCLFHQTGSEPLEFEIEVQ